MWLWGVEVSMVNSFMMYRQYHELKGIPLKYDHYQFHEACGLAYVKPKTMWPKQQKKTRTKTLSPPPPPPKRSKSEQAPEESSRSPKITTAALCCDSGSMMSRLDTTRRHLPVPVQGKRGVPICQLHRWAHWERYGPKDNSTPPGSRSNVMKCEDCGVNLCLRCFYLFHTKRDMEYSIDCIINDV